MYAAPFVNAKAITTEDMAKDTEKDMKKSINQYLRDLKKKVNKKHHVLLEKLFQSAQKYFRYSRRYEIVSEDRGTIDGVNYSSDIKQNMEAVVLWVQWLSGFIPGKKWCDIWDNIAPSLYHPKNDITNKDKAIMEQETLALKKMVSDLMSELQKTIIKNHNKFPETIHYFRHTAPLQKLWNDYVKDFGNLLYAMAEDFWVSSEGQNCQISPYEINKNREVLVSQWTSFLLVERIKDLNHFQKEIEKYLSE